MSQRIFVLGATGYLGSAIAARLARAGHDVTGLTRSGKGLLTLEAIGVRGVRGSVAEPEPWIGFLRNADVAIHAAADYADARLADAQALEAVRIAAEDGRVRRFLYTSGIWDYGSSDTVFDETAPFDPLPGRAWRIAHHDVAFDLAVHEVAVTVLQPAIVYGGSDGLLDALFTEARERGVVPVPGDGRQHWPMIHRDDVAEAYALATERGPAASRLLLADGSALTAREVADAIARATGARAETRSPEDMPQNLLPYGAALLRDQRVSAAKARAELGWTPRHESFAAEVDDLYGEWQSGSPSPVG